MDTKKSKKYIKRLNSREPLRTFSFGNYNANVFPDFTFEAVMNLVNNDPVARGAITHFVDKCMEGDFSVIKKDSKEYDSSFQDRLLREFQFRTNVIRKIFLLGKMYNNVFVEIVRKTDGGVKAINVLDTSNVEARTKPNGDLLQLKSITQDVRTGDYVYWDAKDITWIKFNDRSQGYAPVDFRALWETLHAKDYVRRYVAWLWETGQYRILYNFKDSSDQDIENFLAYSRRHDNNFRAPFITKGEIETRILRDIKEQDSIDLLFKYYDNQIAIALRVPPIDLGIPDASGRSNADAQTNNFNTHVRSFKTIVEDGISHDLFPKINHGNHLLRFAPNDRFVEKQVFEVVQMMKAVNFTDEAISEYLYDRGLVFKSNKLFNEPMDRVMEAVNNPREKDTAPSRQGKTEGEANSELEEVSTRDDQIRKE